LKQKWAIGGETSIYLLASGGRRNRNETETGDWGAIGDPINNNISIVLPTMSDQML